MLDFAGARVPNRSMEDQAQPIRLSGTLVRDDGGFVLRCDGGKQVRLLLHRVPVDLVEKRVTVTGRPEGDWFDADGVAPA